MNKVQMRVENVSPKNKKKTNQVRVENVSPKNPKKRVFRKSF